MIWVNDTQCERAKHLKEEGLIVGTVVFIRPNCYHATTMKHHLGFYKSEGVAMLAVETKHKHELKEAAP